MKDLLKEDSESEESGMKDLLKEDFNDEDMKELLKYSGMTKEMMKECRRNAASSSSNSKAGAQDVTPQRVKKQVKKVG